jgi:methionyl aminopeptidase
MIRLKTAAEIEMMRIPAKVTGRILYELREMIRPGISTLDIDRYVEEQIRKEGMVPSFKGYNGFPASACVSVNEVIIHGIPSAGRILAEGDIVGVDIGATADGWVSDAARTYPVGVVSDEARRLIETCEDCFFDCIACCRTGHRLTDIGDAIQMRAESKGYSVVREYVGHGIGRDMHEDPQVKNYGPPGKGPKLMSGMVLAIEPMINVGVQDSEVLMDNWTVVTADGNLSAHYENTVAITDGEPDILTLDEREGRGAMHG